MNPFVIDGPTVVSFSGGRTSAYLARRVLDANAPAVIAEHVRFCFANTGKEEAATLAFVKECGERWGIAIDWIEWLAEDPGYRRVTYETAARNGEPFQALIAKRNYLPNPVTRFCTAELKIIAAEKFLRHGLGWQEWDNMVGIRADEPRRVAKIRQDPSGGRRGVERLMPLADAGIGVQDVLAFWRAADFDLGLPTVNGKAMHGNCDLCFLKPPAQRLSLIREKPERAVWWAAMEASIQSAGQIKGDGARFTKDGPSYAQMAQYADSQEEMFDPDQDAIACFCGD